MKHAPMVLTVLTVLGLTSTVWAGPNAGGTLVVHDAIQCVGSICEGQPLCVFGNVPAHCGEVDTEVEYSTETYLALIRVYAAFSEGSGPRLMGITWGVSYDPNKLTLATGSKCGNFELNDENWPAAGTGSTVTWDVAQTGFLTPVYWFFAYTYGTPTPSTLDLGPNPSQGGFFGDDTVPAVLDPIMGYGKLGFLMPGLVACPDGPQAGACCIPWEPCQLMLPQECEVHGGWFFGAGVTCDPDPCYHYGACCFPDGSCIEDTDEHCLAVSNIFIPDVRCTPNPCGVGACCMSDGSCQGDLVEAWCVGYGGSWIPDVSCTPNPCPPVPVERETWGRIKQTYR